MTEQPTPNGDTSDPTPAEDTASEPARPGEVRTQGETSVDDAIGAADDPS